MPDNLRALLAAIVSDPADDTARLVYADCLQEHGNTVRAQFIRLQIEAEELHPDSNARARLEKRAHAILADHWMGWWGEVCNAVGFPMPVPKPRGALGRLVQRIGKPSGHPYALPPLAPEIMHWDLSRDPRFGGWDRSIFQRGFPDSIHVSLEHANSSLGFLQHWTTVAPLEEVHFSAPFSEIWTDGPHLSNLRSLTLLGYDPSALVSVLTSPHLGQLQELRLHVWHHDAEYDVRFADELARAVLSPRMRQLKRLRIPLWTDRAAEVLATADSLAGLEALEVAILPHTARKGRGGSRTSPRRSDGSRCWPARRT